MTVADWIRQRAPRAPEVLADRVIAVLGAAAVEPEARTSDVCLRAAAEMVQSIVRDQRFGRQRL